MRLLLPGIRLNYLPFNQLPNRYNHTISNTSTTISRDIEYNHTLIRFPVERWWHKKHGNSVDLIKRIVEYQTFLNFLNSFEHFVTVYRCNPSSRRYIPVGQFDLVSVDGKLVTAGLPPSSSCVHTRIFYLFKVSVKRPICRERCTALSCFNSDTWDACFV